MRRRLAVVFLVWGVATILLAGINASLGSMPRDNLIPALVGGAILLAIAWWLDRAGRRGPPG